MNHNPNRNTTLDLLKLFAAYMVVFIHIAFSGNVGFAFDALARFAVPLFFMISGYFCYNSTPAKIKKKCFHIGSLYLSATIVYHLYRILYPMMTGHPEGILEYYSQYFGLKPAINYFLFNVSVSAGHLWFLLALFYIYIIQYFLSKYHVSDKIIFLFSFLAIGIHLVLGELLLACGIAVPAPYIRNFLLMGYPCFGLGLFIKKQESRLCSLPNTALLILLIIGIAETLCSRWFIGKNELYAGSLLIALSLMIFAVKYPAVTQNRFLMKWSSFNTNIYLYHRLVISLLTIYLSASAINTGSLLVVNALPILVCILTTLLAWILSLLHRLK